MNAILRARLLRPVVIASIAIPTPSSCAVQLYRQYHSYQHPPSLTPFPPAESAILSAALLHVPSNGFSNAALTLGARDAGYLDISVNLLPRGVFDLVRYHLATERLRLKERVDFCKFESQQGQEGLGNFGISDKIRALCKERLKANTPIIHQWQEALALMSLTGNIPTSISELAKLSDEIWFLAGDKSHDTTWYTKRATLSAVYASAELFMTNDKSKDFKDTWEFLDRRLGRVEAIGTTVSNVSSYIDFTAHAFVNVLRSRNFPFF